MITDVSVAVRGFAAHRTPTKDTYVAEFGVIRLTLDMPLRRRGDVLLKTASAQEVIDRVAALLRA